MKRLVTSVWPRGYTRVTVGDLGLAPGLHKGDRG